MKERKGGVLYRSSVFQVFSRQQNIRFITLATENTLYVKRGNMWEHIIEHERAGREEGGQERKDWADAEVGRV
ncbi:hypothetical protein INR49_012508 [Caranx melampygus]|nr:hypothetical protein INR49_012508 [Caranx melampygus]